MSEGLWSAMFSEDWSLGQLRNSAPFQRALRTRAGCCVSHVLQTLTDLDPRATVLPVDGVGAFDLVSRKRYDARVDGHGRW